MNKPSSKASTNAARAPRGGHVAAWTLAAAATVWSAAAVKEAGKRPPLLADVHLTTNRPVIVEPKLTAVPEFVGPVLPPGLRVETVVVAAPVVVVETERDRLSRDPSVRWFDGRPVRPVRRMNMEVTGYSPDARSCGDSADGLTATLHAVETNGFALVAADPTVLGYGSLVSVPGYDDGRIVPVLDCGGAIKGRKLDLLFPTHERARVWGRKSVRVTVWEYADGKPATNPRKVR